MSERVQITMKKALERARKSEEFGQGLSKELDRLFKAGLINLQEDKPEFLANFFTDEEIAAYTTYEFSHLSERGEFAIKRARYLNGSNFDRVARILPELKLYCKKNLPGSKFAPPLSNRGCIKYKPQTKNLRDVRDTEPEEDFFKPLWTGYDSIQECFNVSIKECYVEQLKQSQERAQYVGHDITISGLKFGASEFQISPRGAKGFTYMLQTDDVMLLISNPANDWAVSVRYLSAGLIEWGIEALRDQVFRLLDQISVPRSADYARLSRIDVATDFYSQKFAECLKPSILDGLVLPAKCKARNDELLSMYIQSGRLDTLTIGTKKSLQLQVYDKAKEIEQASGKTYFYKLWGMVAKANVWRFEVRFFSEFLRNRGILTFEQFEEFRNELISEALNIRRLTVPSSDKNRSRWAYHPLYTFVRRQFVCGDYGLAIGRYVTGQRQVLAEQAIKRIAGDVRSLSVLVNYGFYDERQVEVIFGKVYRQIKSDKQHADKCDAAAERYKFVGEAVA